MILHGHYSEIEPAMESLLVANVFGEERVRIMRASRARLIEELDACYVHSLDQLRNYFASSLILLLYDVLCMLDVLSPGK